MISPKCHCPIKTKSNEEQKTTALHYACKLKLSILFKIFLPRVSEKCQANVQSRKIYV